MKKKIVSMLLVLGMTAGMFTGCGKEQSVSKESSENTGASVSEVTKTQI